MKHKPEKQILFCKLVSYFLDYIYLLHWERTETNEYWMEHYQAQLYIIFDHKCTLVRLDNLKVYHMESFLAK